MRTVARIRDIAVSLGLEPDKIHVVINRYRFGMAPVDTGSTGTMAILPDDPAIEAADLAAEPVSKIPYTSPAREEIRKLAGKILEMEKGRD
jgi:CO dehydrogenase maturation factor